MGRSFLAAVFLLIATLASSHAVELPTLNQPSWKELSTEQKQILAPLAADWDRMDSLRRKKWVGIAARYPNMNPEEQMRVQSQMREWAKLSPQQRKLAREKYKTLSKAPPEQKASVKQQWEAYKDLPDDEKKRLQDAAKVRAPVKATGKSAINGKPALTPAAVLVMPKTKTATPATPTLHPPAADLKVPVLPPIRARISPAQSVPRTAPAATTPLQPKTSPPPLSSPVAAGMGAGGEPAVEPVSGADAPPEPAHQN